MSARTFASMVIIVLVVLGFITIHRLRDFPPADNCCRHYRNVNSTTCWACDEFNVFERIIYVWRYPNGGRPDQQR